MENRAHNTLSLLELRPHASIVTLATTVYLLLAANFSQAQTTNWTLPGTGDWFLGANWDNNIPDSTTDATLGNGGTAQIDSGDAATSYLRIENGSIVGIGGDASLTVTNSSAGNAKIRIGGNSNSSGTFEIGGTSEVTSYDGSLGQLSGGSGTLNMSGGSWTLTNELIIGRDSIGIVNLTGGEIIAAPFAAGGISIAQSNSGTGTLNIGTGTTTGILNTKVIKAGSGIATLNFNHSEADYQFSKDGTASGQKIKIEGNVDVNHVGSGTTTLVAGGSYAYTGTTIVSDGTLLVNGMLVDSTITVEDGGTLGGTGSLQSVIVESGGILSPGTSPGEMNLASLELQGNSTLQIEVAGTLPGLFDKLMISGDGTLGGLLDISYLDTFAAMEGDSFTILETDGALSGTFSGFNAPDSQNWQVSYDYVNGMVNLAVIPEPSGTLLIGLSMIVLAVRRKNR